MAFDPSPGTGPLPEDLQDAIAAAVARRNEPPRTHHKRPDGSPRFANRLALETSPYLLQHAHNPVDWRPWGDEAFAAARAADKPVFLSVGYSTCHWCHVMEEESFEDLQIAQLLNERFVCIKVDREERPDVDAIYMQAVQLLTHHGGWPMSVFLTHDRKPFYGGTYFPPRDGMRGARVGFGTVITELHRIFAEQRDKAVQSADEIARIVQRSLAGEAPSSLPGQGVLHAAMGSYAASFDAREGGLRRAPKFPSSLNVPFLLRYWKRTGDDVALKMAALSLEKMAAGGMYDQLGGGFHRYSTDAEWLVPHFEKMLYDNALLASAYLEGFLAIRDERLAWICKDILDYVAREMTDANGGFWSATDADSEGEEGKFFVWTPAEVKSILGDADGEQFCKLYDVTEAGNWEGRSILHLQGLPADRSFFERVRPKLYDARKKRVPPLTDRKVLAAWNGLMISAFARAGLWLDRADFVQRAEAAASYLLSVHLVGGKLHRSSLEGVARHPGLLEDYANLAAGLVDLYEASGEPKWLQAALGLHETLRAEFRDEAGGYFRTPADHEALLAREKPLQDGAEPCGNSTAALTLLRLAAHTSDDRFRGEAEGILRAAGPVLEQYPQALGQLLLALDWLEGDPREVVLLRPDDGSDAALMAVLRARYLPNLALIKVSLSRADEHALSRGRGLVAGKPAAYLCRQGACGLPTADAEQLGRQLDERPPGR